MSEEEKVGTTILAIAIIAAALYVFLGKYVSQSNPISVEDSSTLVENTSISVENTSIIEPITNSISNQYYENKYVVDFEESNYALFNMGFDGSSDTLPLYGDSPVPTQIEVNEKEDALQFLNSYCEGNTFKNSFSPNFSEYGYFSEVSEVSKETGRFIRSLQDGMGMQVDIKIPSNTVYFKSRTRFSFTKVEIIGAFRAESFNSLNDTIIRVNKNTAKSGDFGYNMTLCSSFFEFEESTDEFDLSIQAIVLGQSALRTMCFIQKIIFYEYVLL